MIKIGLVSDLHLRHWNGYQYLGNPLDSIKESLQKETPDILLDAGDYEIEYFEDLLKVCPNMAVAWIQGNHDYYGKLWHDYFWSMSIKKINVLGLNIGLATFWVDFKGHNKELMRIYEKSLADCWAIKAFNAQVAYECHQKHKQWLYEEHKNQPFDIIVTHHSPTWKAVHPRYTTYEHDIQVSYGFSSDLDQVVLDLAPKVWHFGHTHDPYDFMIGNTRMINNPCGYPSEAKGIRLFKPYEPFYIEIENDKASKKNT